MDKENKKIYELIILGAGPAGTAAGVYAARKKIKALLITENFGGQAVVAATIENIVGFEEISGMEMAMRFEKQLRRQLDLEIVVDCILEIKNLGEYFEVKTNNGNYFGERLLVCLGRRYRKLNVPKEKELEGKGVFYCSTCDAPILKNKKAAVIGGGNSGLLAVLDLIPYASKIYLLTNEPFLRGDQILQERVKKESKVEIFYNTQIIEFLGDKFITGLKFKDKIDNSEKVLEINGVFIEAGMEPNSELIKDLVKLNEAKEVIVDGILGRTSHSRIWAAGDITNLPFKQITVAMGDGVRALLDIYNNIQRKQNEEFI